MIEGLVSAIVPVHNRPLQLGDAVHSVLAQTYRPIEVIIVDDGSTDETPAVVDALAAKHPAEIRVIHQANAGPGLAREAGRRAARGEFIQYVDSDDVLMPEKFELQVAGLRANPDCGVAYGCTRFLHTDGRVEVPLKGTGTRVDKMFPGFLRSRWWSTVTPLFRTSICDAAGPWTDLLLEEDWEYDCRVAALNVKLHFCDACVAEVRDHGQNRLSRGAALDATRLSQRARAHALIYAHALRGGVGVGAPEMQHFARELFLLARQCGAAGLGTESQELFSMARKASGAQRAKGFDFRLYAAVAALLGWRLTGRLACATDWFRR
jgi:glycosyltransferase involved in cell wall biosynthesis